MTPVPPRPGNTPPPTGANCAGFALRIPNSAHSYSDAAEAMANAVIGLVVSWCATLFVLGYSPAQAVGVTLMFFALSFGRSWLLRRLFRRLA